jgi:hypothetical protein
MASINDLLDKVFNAEASFDSVFPEPPPVGSDVAFWFPEFILSPRGCAYRKVNAGQVKEVTFVQDEMVVTVGNNK